MSQSRQYHHNQLVSRHITQWFHRVGIDELSPSLTILDFNQRILEYVDYRKLSIAISKQAFRNNMCQFICTYYKANKQDATWRGPLSKQVRPRGWTPSHETEWIEYLQYHHFTSEFWSNFWNAIPEGIWETRTPHWREAVQHVVLHYIHVHPKAIEFYEDGSDSEDTVYEDY
jgi:hypothetical protein